MILTHVFLPLLNDWKVTTVICQRLEYVLPTEAEWEYVAVQVLPRLILGEIALPSSDANYDQNINQDD